MEGYIQREEYVLYRTHPGIEERMLWAGNMTEEAMREYLPMARKTLPDSTFEVEKETVILTVEKLDW